MTIARTVLLCFAAGGVCVPAGSDLHAGTLEDIRLRGYFTWGGDEEGGGPFIFPDPAQPARRTGFEVDLAAELAGELARAWGRPIEARFSQGQWDKLPDLLGTGRIDLVLNGYEWSPERARVMASTIPYYVYELQLLARAGDDRVPGWDALAGGRKLKVGVLGGSAAERYLEEKFPQVELRSYDGNTNALGEVERGRLDATVQDLPIALFYRRDFPGLKFVGEPVAPGRYVIFIRREDDALRGLLDQAIIDLRARGVLRRIYERYGIWTAIQEDPVWTSLPREAGAAAAPSGAAAFFAKHGLTLLEAARMTVILSLASFPLAVVLGLLVALGRLYGPKTLSFVLACSVEVLRGTPLMLQLFVIFYVLPAAGLSLDPFPAAVIGLAVNYAAYESEIYRAGLLAVPAGQMEAALALGMTRALALRRIIVPQAMRIVLPPVTNDFIALFKDTSVCSVITVVELTKRYNIAVMTNPAEVLPLAVVTGVLYLAMSYPLSLVSSRMEKWLRA